MPEFAYRGWNAQREAVSGEIAAETVAQAVMQVESQGIEIASIGLVERKETVVSAAVPESIESAFDRDLLRAPIQQVLEQGKLILPALHAFAAELPHGRRKKQIEKICQIIDDANASEALQGLVENPEYWLPLVGTMSSKHDPVRAVRSFFAESQSAEEQRSQWRRAIVYPLVCLTVTYAVLTAMSFYVFPVFRGILGDFEIVLPVITTFALDTASVLAHPVTMTIVFLLIVASILALTADRWMSARRRQVWSSRLPRLVTAATVARFSNFTADLLEAGVQTSAAIRIAGLNCGIPRLRKAVWQLAYRLDRSEALAGTLRPLTETLIYAIRASLPDSARIRLLREIATIYAEKMQSRISWSRGVVEPILICLIGLLVGMFVLALLLPLVVLVESLT